VDGGSEKNGDEMVTNYKSHKPKVHKLVPNQNEKLKPIFPINEQSSDNFKIKKGSTQNRSSANLISPQSRSQYGKFGGKFKGKIQKIKNSRGGSGGSKRRKDAKARLSPLPVKPSKHPKRAGK
jgi:hypothetical protein